MKNLIIFLLLISISIFAKTRGDLKSDLSSFASSKTSSSSGSSSSNDDDDDDDDGTPDEDTTDFTDYHNSKPSPFGLTWYFDSLFSRNSKFFPKDKSLLFIGTSYNYQNWTPTGINHATTDTTVLSFLKIEASALYDSIYFNYETSFYGANLEAQRELLKIREREKHGWERFMTEITLPFAITLGHAPFARVYLGYDEQVFISTVTSLEDKYYIPRSESGKPDSEDVEKLRITTGDKIVTTTLFKDWYIGFKMDFHHILKYNIGIFYLTYNKPYSLTIDGEQFDEQIHDTDFSAIGPYMDFIIDYKIFHIKTGFKLGGGSVDLVGLDIKVDEIVDSLYHTMYFQFNGDFGVQYQITKAIKFQAIMQIEYRNFYLSKADSNEDDDIDDSESLDLNSDFIFTAFAGFSYSF